MSDVGPAQPQFATEPVNCSAEENHKLSQEVEPERAVAPESTPAGQNCSKELADFGETRVGPGDEPATEGALTRGVVGEKRGGPVLSESEERLSGSSLDVQRERKLAVADWSPFNDVSTAQKAGPDSVNGFAETATGCPRRPPGIRSTVQHSRSSSEATESDFEKDAAETYISKSRQRAPGE